MIYFTIGDANQTMGLSNTVRHPSNDPFIEDLDNTNPIAVSTADAGAEGDVIKSADAATDRQTEYDGVDIK
jgi:hypothetical protein